VIGSGNRLTLAAFLAMVLLAGGNADGVGALGVALVACSGRR
jgi:hypothetical protein